MPEDASPDSDVAKVRGERDLYRKLLELGRKDEIEPFIEEALALFVAVTGARRGYLELHDDRGADGSTRFWIARGCSDEELAQIREAFSRGVIAEALATGKIIVTASALLDPRFRDLGSVRRNRIEAVLCAPLGANPPVGVLYLQDRLSPGPFTDEDRAITETVAGHIGEFAGRLLLGRRTRDASDATMSLRRTLKLDGLIGRSAALARVLQQVANVAQLPIGVVLTGPSGTGKTQLARILHDNGPRAQAPFVELNCATITAPLFESELFGAVPGAHSTATKRVDGKVAAAEGGTLFLDEIAEIPLGAQAKLLQLLESKEYFPLGSSRPLRADVRIIAATNGDLKAAIARREFREDLFYRIHVVPIRVPSLGERREDISELCAHFSARASESYNLPRLGLSLGAVRAAEAAEWAGNVRELGHAVQAAVIRAAGEGVPQLEAAHLFPDATAATPGAPVTFQQATQRFQADLLETGARLTFQQATRVFQGQLLQRALDDAGWNITETAARLDITRSHVYNLIRLFGLERRRS